MRSIELLEAGHVNFKTIHLGESVRTARDVADAYNCDIAQVLKTLVFICDNSPLIAIIQGDSKVDTRKLSRLFGKNSIRMASAEEVFSITSYAVGSVSPLGLPKSIDKIMDGNILNLQTVLIGSGEEKIIIQLDSSSLQQAWNGRIGDITKNL